MNILYFGRLAVRTFFRNENLCLCKAPLWPFKYHSLKSRSVPFPQFPISLPCQKCCKPLPEWTERRVAKWDFSSFSLSFLLSVVLMRKSLQCDWNPWVLSVNFSPLECVTVITTRGDVVSLNKHTGSQTQRGVYLAFSRVTVLPMRMSGAATVPVKQTFWTAWAVASWLGSYVTTKTNNSGSFWALPLLLGTALMHYRDLMLHFRYILLVVPMLNLLSSHEERKQKILSLFSLFFRFHLSLFLSYLLLLSLPSPLSWQLLCVGPRGCVVKCCHITL